MRNFDEREQGFVERNLNDTKYVARALLSSLRDLYGEGEPDPAREGYLRTKRRLFARPGAVTALLRKAWGLNGIKDRADRSEEHTSELQSLMRISYAVFCLKKKKDQHQYR